MLAYCTPPSSAGAQEQAYVGDYVYVKSEKFLGVWRKGSVTAIVGNAIRVVFEVSEIKAAKMLLRNIEDSDGSPSSPILSKAITKHAASLDEDLIPQEVLPFPSVFVCQVTSRDVYVRNGHLPMWSLEDVEQLDLDELGEEHLDHFCGMGTSFSFVSFAHLSVR